MSEVIKVWNRGITEVDREEHNYYVDGKFAGAVYRDGQDWCCCAAGHDSKWFTVKCLADGMAMIERGAGIVSADHKTSAAPERVYLVVQAGVYRHDIRGVYTSADAAVAAAKRANEYVDDVRPAPGVPAFAKDHPNGRAD